MVIPITKVNSVFEGKKSCVLEPLEQGRENGHQESHVGLREDLVKKRASSSTMSELNSDRPRRHHAFFEEPLSSSLLLLDSVSLKVKYFKEKAKLRQKLIKGFDDGSDDREEEEEIRDDRLYAGTSINLATKSASVDEGFGQEARNRKRDWKEDASSSSPIEIRDDRLYADTSINLATKSASVDEGFGQEARDRKRDWKEDESSSSPIEIRDDRLYAGTNVNLATKSASVDEGFGQEARNRKRDWKEDASSSSPIEIRDDRLYADTNVNLATKSASVDEGFGQEARDRKRDWKEDESSSSPVVFNKGRIHHHTYGLSAASSHESDIERRHMQRIYQKGQFKNSDSIQHHISPLSDTSPHENKSEREYPMQRSRQKRRVDNNYSRHYSQSSNYASYEESWTWHPRKRPDSRHSTTHSIGRSTNRYDEEWQPHSTCTHKQPSHSYDSTTPVTPHQHAIHDGQLRNGSLSICEEPEPHRYHIDRSSETKHHRRAQNETHTDRRCRTREKGPTLITGTAPCRKKKISFDERIDAVRNYKRVHGNLNISTDKFSPTGTLGNWLVKARRDLKLREQGIKPKFLSPSHDWKWETLKQILVMDTDAEPHRENSTATERGTFDEVVEALRKYKKIHGNLNMQTDRTSSITTLGIWLMKARADLELVEMGFKPEYFFPSHDWKWEILRQLGVADATISMHNNGQRKMKMEVNRLEDTEMAKYHHSNFSNHGDYFHHRVKELKRFKMDNGHFNVPICGDLYMPLGIWCRAVKRAALDLQNGGSRRTPKPVTILGTEMSTERLRILAEIGFISDNINNQEKVIEVE